MSFIFISRLFRLVNQIKDASWVFTKWHPFKVLMWATKLVVAFPEFQPLCLSVLQPQLLLHFLILPPLTSYWLPLLRITHIHSMNRAKNASTCSISHFIQEQTPLSMPLLPWFEAMTVLTATSSITGPDDAHKWIKTKGYILSGCFKEYVQSEDRPMMNAQCNAELITKARAIGLLWLPVTSNIPYPVVTGSATSLLPFYPPSLVGSPWQVICTCSLLHTLTLPSWFTNYSPYSFLS